MIQLPPKLIIIFHKPETQNTCLQLERKFNETSKKTKREAKRSSFLDFSISLTHSQLFGFDLLLLPEPVHATVCVSLQFMFHSIKTSITKHNPEHGHYKVNWWRAITTNLSTDETAERKCGELSSVDTIGIKMTNVKLNRSMTL